MAEKEIIHGSICWNCKKACTERCRKPVEGWDAIYRPLVYEKKSIPSWYVLKCPNYEMDHENVVFSHENILDKQTAAAEACPVNGMSYMAEEVRYG